MLWLQRTSAASAPHYSLADLQRLDLRLEAHLDGLRLAGEEGWQVCAEQLAVQEAGEMFTAALLAFASGDRTRIAQVLDAAVAEPSLEEGVISALGWLPLCEVSGEVAPLLGSEKAGLRRIGAGLCAVHRHFPGGALWQLLRDHDPGVRARAARAVGEMGQSELLNQVEAAAASEVGQLRFWSWWSVVLLTGASGSMAQLQSLMAGVDERLQEEAVELIIRRMPRSAARQWQRQLADHSNHGRLGLAAAAALGEPGNVPWLLDQMKNPVLARKAGEAFTTITGVDLAFRDLEQRVAPPHAERPTDAPEDENVALDPDEDLAWPDPLQVRTWWEGNSGRWEKDTCYLLGQPITIEWLRQVLRDGRQRHRAAAALELSIRSPGLPLFNVKAPGFRQVQMLGRPGEPIQ